MPDVVTHTPPPWSQEDNQIFQFDSGMLICTLTSGDDFPCVSGDDEQSEAEARAALDLECAMNGRLIESAPLLKERLEAILAWADLALSAPNEFDKHGVKNLSGPIFDAARVVLDQIDGKT